MEKRSLKAHGRYLFKEPLFRSVKATIADELMLAARNSAVGILLIWEAVEYQFYTVNFGRLVELIKEGLSSNDVLALVKFPLSDEFRKRHECLQFWKLEISFFDYYWSRLPVMLKCNRFSQRRPSDSEIEAIAYECFVKLVERHPNVHKDFTFSGTARMFERLTKWYVKPSARDDAVYDIAWLWRVLRELFPELMSISNNVNDVTTWVIEGCFPMFWDALRARYAQHMIHWARIGYFVGHLEFLPHDLFLPSVKAMLEDEQPNGE